MPTLEAPTPLPSHNIHVNLHICLIPQDTGLVGGALEESEESGSCAHPTGPAKVTARTHPQVC